MSSFRGRMTTLLKPLLNIIPFGFLPFITREKLILPFYHLVSNDENPHIRHLYKVRSVDLFKKDLDFLLKYYSPLSLPDFLDVIKGKELKKNAFFLSFDDGLKDIYHIIAPILKSKGIPATFFINPAFVDNKELFYRHKASLLIDKVLHSSSHQKSISDKIGAKSLEDIRLHILSIDYNHSGKLDELAILLEVDFDLFLSGYQPYMSTEQIQKLQHEGFDLGAHSIDHPKFADISLEEQIRQVKESIEWMHHKFGVKEKLFAFPFTDSQVSKKFFDTVAERDIVSYTFGTAGIKKDMVPQNIQRIPMETGLEPAKNIIAMEYMLYLCKLPFRKNIIQRH